MNHIIRCLWISFTITLMTILFDSPTWAMISALMFIGFCILFNAGAKN